ncbi:cip1-interacting zinc finger protein-like isoform X4 [Myxocyprinus asiaticus]|uniref:cip1-interacting zinc finger protein-like isoform X4 n=1 Tax=Myxocyprinus asiaticus TaxID=70543 RepID=UPI002221AF23|nr:cip1-interacting zinc finger protein-like isoform X4 [Myxocyprinus asiaticus]
MFNPHQHQQQFHQHLRQLQQLFQQQTPPPPPPPPPPPQPPPAHHITHHHQTARSIAVPAPAPPPARMVNLCSATQTIIAPNPMLQGALLMQQMQAGSMRGFAMGGQQFPQFFTPGSRTSLLGPVPMGVAIKTPHMGFPRHFTPHARYFSNDYQSRQPDRKRESEHKSAVSNDSQSEASSSRAADEAAGVADPGCQSSSEPLDEPAAKKQKTDGSEELVETESAQISEYKSPDPAECPLQEAGSMDGPVAAEADEQSRVAKRCSRSSCTSCTVCKHDFRTPREFVEHMQSTEHKQRVEQLWKESGKDGMDELNTESFLGDEDGDFTDDEREEEENGKEGLSAQMEVTLEDMTEDEEFDPDTVYGSSFVVPVAGFLCRLCNHFYHFESSARHAHCKTLKHFHNLKSYKALKTHEDAGSTSAAPADHHSPDQTSTREPPFTSPESLNPKPALQMPWSSCSSSLPVLSISSNPETNRTPNQQPKQDDCLTGVAHSTPPCQSGEEAEDEPITGQPEEEEEEEEEGGGIISEGRGVKGRDRTLAKRRGRGGRRR